MLCNVLLLCSWCCFILNICAIFFFFFSLSTSFVASSAERHESRIFSREISQIFTQQNSSYFFFYFCGLYVRRASSDGNWNLPSMSLPSLEKRGEKKKSLYVNSISHAKQRIDNEDLITAREPIVAWHLQNLIIFLVHYRKLRNRWNRMSYFPVSLILILIFFVLRWK